MTEDNNYDSDQATYNQCTDYIEALRYALGKAKWHQFAVRKFLLGQISETRVRQTEALNMLLVKNRPRRPKSWAEGYSAWKDHSS